ncbi:nucleotidyltransferase family protein [Thalassotalea ponticola]|uniref:N-acetylmuramate alpha-1-phosphate uridylyltransferase MurU n=1 Tax=Thalassotalea ponticola TaxID=1523392 RepID=UPI0025B44051|nr:nucleotidyltransferase family protein [Thalassotalea ponticola]MDN3653621.1 nucleotidyltransferase family protein [Thalassotalea ponticola]
MKVMILAAGRGERMRPLTDHTPKPLLKVCDKPLIEHHITRLKAAGFDQFVINLAYLGEQIEGYFGNGQNWGVDIAYSWELEGALETAGGIANALNLLGNEPFLVVNGDVYCDIDYRQLCLPKHSLAHLIMVSNPDHHPAGDFSLVQGKLRSEGNENRLTYSGIGIFRPALFTGLAEKKQALGPILRQAMLSQAISAEHYQGLWSDVGTPYRLQQLEQQLQRDNAIVD